MDSDDSWTGVPVATMFSARVEHHTAVQASSPMQLVLGQDAILDLKHVSDWEHIRQQKQTEIISENENDKGENQS
jgi:hypothetical protein